MPITRRQFELGINEELESYMKKIHEFLFRHIDEAYSSDELISTIRGEPFSTFMDTEKIEKALYKLVEIEAVEQRVIKNQDYFAYLGPLKL